MNRQSLEKPLMPLLAQAQILLKHWLDDERIRSVDWHLARQAVEYEINAGNTSDTDLAALLFAACSCSYVLGRGQVCIDINRWVLPEVSDETVRHVMSAENISRCQVVKVSGDNNIEPDSYKNIEQAFDKKIEGVKFQQTRTPLFVLNNNRLYLSRYFSYEQSVLKQLSSRLSPTHLDDNDVQESPKHIEALANYLQILFPKTNQEPKADPQAINDQDINDLGIDWQAIAAAVACTQPVTVITGGPGTGKTTTVTKLLSALLSQTPGLRIALAAPTGKAAARMTESIRQARSQMADTTGMHGIPNDSYTLHRLLGWSPRGFRYNAKRHLPFDCVVVDEASMIDLPMMAHLFNALSPSTRIILLGDRDQLASVEAGSVLADLCDAGTDHGFTPEFSTHLSKLVGIELHAYSTHKGSAGTNLPMQNAVVQLRKSHRFSADSGIGALARAVNAGDQNAASSAFNHFDDVQWLVPEGKSWQRKVLEGYRNYCTLVQENASAEEILNAFDEFQVLVALRKGNWGVEETNRQIERLLSKAGILKGTTQQWYSGRAVMITRNDYDLGLFNGDIGILVKLEDSDAQLIERVAFRAADGGVRYMSPGRLPSHETAFAITVHKSQGSEFRDVLLLLPEQWQQVITRELIYTAITRAKLSFCCQAGDVCWAQGLNTQVLRASGLRDALWGQ